MKKESGITMRHEDVKILSMELQKIDGYEGITVPVELLKTIMAIDEKADAYDKFVKKTRAANDLENLQALGQNAEGLFDRKISDLSPEEKVPYNEYRTAENTFNKNVTKAIEEYNEQTVTIADTFSITEKEYLAFLFDTNKPAGVDENKKPVTKKQNAGISVLGRKLILKYLVK